MTPCDNYCPGTCDNPACEGRATTRPPVGDPFTSCGYCGGSGTVYDDSGGNIGVTKHCPECRQ